MARLFSMLLTGAVMSLKRNSVLPKRTFPDASRFHALFIAGLARVSAKLGRGTVADAMGRSSRALDNMFGGSCPTAKALLDTLAADETTLDELLAEYGFRLVPLDASRVSDLDLAAAVIGAMGNLVQANSNGIRDHNETLALGALLRPHLPGLTAIVREADVLRCN
jgi:hypothetical protein